jgi:hypothetical protein
MRDSGFDHVHIQFLQSPGEGQPLVAAEPSTDGNGLLADSSGPGYRIARRLHARIPVVYSPRGRLTAINATLVDLPVRAYHTRAFNCRAAGLDRSLSIRRGRQGRPHRGRSRRKAEGCHAPGAAGRPISSDLSPRNQSLRRVCAAPRQVSGLEKSKDRDRSSLQTVQRKLVFTNMSMGGLVNALSNIV